MLLVLEVDFLFQNNGENIAIEVKSRMSSEKIDKGLRNYIEDYEPDKVFILNENIEANSKILNTKIKFLNHLNIYQILNQNIKDT